MHSNSKQLWNYFRMGLMEASMTAGMLIGLASTSYLYQAVGYSYVFLICSGFMGLSILHILFIIKESKQTQKKPQLEVHANLFCIYSLFYRVYFL